MTGDPREKPRTAAGPVPGWDLRRPLDPRDHSRRTVLADERTAPAWWRTA